MRRKSPENESRRRNEIIDSCEVLYRERGFRDITIKDISEALSISRPAIYKYYETKEEIFLDLIIREAGAWLEEVRLKAGQMETMSKAEFAEIIAGTVSEKKILLKIFSMNIYEIENNSRMERLTAYKSGFKEIRDVLFEAMGKIAPRISMKRQEQIIRLLFPFLNGVYAYSEPTEKQWEAMNACGLQYEAPALYDYVYEFLVELL